MNHSRVDIRSTSISCAVIEVSRIADELQEVVFQIANHFYHPSRGDPPAFVMWSNLGSVVNNGSRLSSFVTDHGFGPITRTGNAINPKTGSVVCVWVWEVDHAKLKTWYKEEKVRKLKAS